MGMRKKFQGRELREWVKIALGVELVMLLFVITDPNYRKGDLFSPVSVFDYALTEGHLWYFAVNVLFYMYGIGLIYQAYMGRFFEEKRR